jgi:type 1 glutamine amidotransferase
MRQGIRPRLRMHIALVCLLVGGIAACGLNGAESAPTGAPAPPAQPATFEVLVFTRTEGFRHGSIEAGVAALRELGAANGFAVTHSEDPASFSETTLHAFRVVVFLNTTGDVLDAPQQAVFEDYIREGGGFVGVHSASDTEYEWPWYGALVGAYFASHPAIQPAELITLDAGHPSTAGLPERWARTDEWYNFRAAPGPEVSVLLAIDEASYSGGAMGEDHPMSWHHSYDGGRAWYTALGHTEESYAEPHFRAHLAGGILWAAGAAQGPGAERAHLPLLGG